VTYDIHLIIVVVVSRIFPIQRGLFEDKVANFWCCLDLFVKLRRNVPSSQHLVLLWYERRFYVQYTYGESFDEIIIEQPMSNMSNDFEMFLSSMMMMIMMMMTSIMMPMYLHVGSRG
jgi:hypothetical protein